MAVLKKDDGEDYAERIAGNTVGPLEKLNSPVRLVEADPAWAEMYESEAGRIRSILEHRVLLLEHVGSTSVPGLAAKPVIDIVLGVADSSDEAQYVPDMEAGGYVLRIREPTWFEHRMFRGTGVATHVHVFSAGCEEIERMVLFRDWLRVNPADRTLYENTKRALAAQVWTYTQQYADAKSSVVGEIMARATRRRPR